MSTGLGQTRRSTSPLPPGAFAAALAALPGAGPAWLVGVLAPGGHPQSPERAWGELLAGRLAPPRPRRATTGAGSGPQGLRVSPLAPAGQTPPDAPSGWPGLSPDAPARTWRRCQAAEAQVSWFGASGYPAALAGGPSPPGVLFFVGELALLERPCVALVGTRRCTPEGREVAYRLAYDLAAAGVAVVSGLAAGIDGAAHAGALAAAQAGAAGSTVGVAASGVDVPYPAKHAALWRQVCRQGVVISESPPGQPAQSWRFPSRNRLIAGLSRIVVVVESHIQGGSWHTVEAALQRGVEVAGVPGPVLSPASAGTNLLLREGALLVRNADDVLEAMGLGASPAVQPSLLPPRPSSPCAGGSASPRAGGLGDEGTAVPARGTHEPPGPLGPLERTVYQALGRRPQTVDDLVERCGLPLGAVLIALEHLGEQGAATHHAGWWARAYRR